MSTAIDVKALRQRINWTQDRLARYLGIDRSSVSRMESGQTIRGPVGKLLEALAAAADSGTADKLCPETEAAE